MRKMAVMSGFVMLAQRVWSAAALFCLYSIIPTKSLNLNKLIRNNLIYADQPGDWRV